MSLTVIRPFSRPSASTTGSFSILCRCRISLASSRPVPTGAVTRLRAVISAETGWRRFDSKRRSRFVRMPTRMPSSSVIGTPGDVVALHQLDRVGDEIVRPERDGLDDHPRLGALDLVDLGDLRRRSRGCGAGCRAHPRARSRSRASPPSPCPSPRTRSGSRRAIVRVSRVAVRTSFGSTDDSEGTSSTSSKVSPSLPNFDSHSNLISLPRSKFTSVRLLSTGDRSYQRPLTF